MTDHARALDHYQNAIQALSTDAYDGLSSRERTELLRVLRDEQRRLLRRIAAESIAAAAPKDDPDPSASPPSPPSTALSPGRRGNDAVL